MILLIDEYDVPLAKASEQGYYDQMGLLICNIFGNVLKMNDSLKFAVLTGCMRIWEESFFPVLNNLRILSITDVRFAEYFGFTDKEVRKLLEYYGLSYHYDEIREWYDGYQFGNARLYCPWDIVNYCNALQMDCDAQPQNYWGNMGSNDTVKYFIRESYKSTTRHEIEKLVAGEFITKEIRRRLTYKDMYDSIDNIWSALFIAGYLTQRGKTKWNGFHLAIRKIFIEQILEFNRENITRNREVLKDFCQALKNGNQGETERVFGEYLRQTINIQDTFVKKRRKGNFYYELLLQILGSQDNWDIASNKEYEDGVSVIFVRIDDEEIGIVIGVKYAEDGKLEEACGDALEQIECKQYEEGSIKHILKYGIACYDKRRKVFLAGASHEVK